MIKDPVVEEIRKVRKEIGKKYKAKGQSYFEHICEVKIKHDAPVIAREPKKFKKSKVS